MENCDQDRPMLLQPMRAAVFGAGVSGRAVVRQVTAMGGKATLFDDLEIGAKRELVPHELAEYDVFVFSPGIPPQHNWRKIVAQSVPQEQVFGELGFALKGWPGRVLGVTGTNGKTTVTLLLTALLQSSVKGNVVACGNIGKPCTEAVAEMVNAGKDDWLVVEISSFQAVNINGICLDGLIWTNFAPDHLDYHGSEMDYFVAKAALIKTLKTDAPMVVDTVVATRLRFMEDAAVRRAACFVKEALAGEDAQLLQLPEAFRRLPQRTNFAQVKTLLTALECFPNGAICKRVLQSFELPPHRLHWVEEVEGVSYWNDSKATNAHAAMAALSAFSEPVCWLAGGRNKGLDLEKIAREVSQRLGSGSYVITFGECGAELATAFSDYQIAVENYPNPYSIVEFAHTCAKSRGLQAVVFSPGFASFDFFDGYAERGKNFISQVLCLKASV
jgi:UDP-N-acetylmuramoylalanine--D-glutamate ligase